MAKNERKTDTKRSKTSKPVKKKHVIKHSAISRRRKGRIAGSAISVTKACRKINSKDDKDDKKTDFPGPRTEKK